MLVAALDGGRQRQCEISNFAPAADLAGVNDVGRAPPRLRPHHLQKPSGASPCIEIGSDEHCQRHVLGQEVVERAQRAIAQRDAAEHSDMESVAVRRNDVGLCKRSVQPTTPPR
jgi:hypothetical protein